PPQVVHVDVGDALDTWRVPPQPGEELADAQVVELEGAGRHEVALTLEPKQLVRVLQLRWTADCSPVEDLHRGRLHGRHHAVGLATRPRFKPPESAFFAELPRRFHTEGPRIQLVFKMSCSV